MTSSVAEEIHGGAVERVELRVGVAGLQGGHPRRRQRRRRRLGARRRPATTLIGRVGMALASVHQRPHVQVVVVIVVVERLSTSRVLDRTVLKCNEPHLQSRDITSNTPRDT